MRTLSYFGADPTKQDNSPSLQAALNHGGDILIDEGSFACAQGVIATKPVRLIGESSRSALLCNATIPDNSPLIHVSPDMTYGGDGYEFRDFQIAPGDSMARASAIFFNTTGAGQFLRRTVVDGLIIGKMADQCITSANGNADGLVAPRITNNTLCGGIFLQTAGDSLVIENNLISGDGIGVFATFAAGAACAQIVGNNIVNRGGALYLVGALAPVIQGNNIESVVYGYNGGVDALVFLQDAISAAMVGNNVNSGSTADCIRLSGCKRTYFESGHLQVSGTAKKHLRREWDQGSIVGGGISYLDAALGAYVNGYFA